MDNERLKFEGRAAEKKRELYSTGLRIKGLRDSIREKLDPFEDDFENIDADIVAENGMQLAKLCIEYKTLKSDIAAIEKALGR